MHKHDRSSGRAGSTAPPPLSRGFKAVFACGSMAEAIVFSITGQFALIYYNQVRGLAPDRVGAVLAAGLVVNAGFEPLIGSWSDRTRSRLGRRHPFMFAAILPIAVSFWAMFSPPAGLTSGGELAWLGTANLVLLQGLSVFHTPHLAFGGELSGDYLERSRIMGWNTFFLWSGDTVCWLLSFGWFFRAAAGHPSGALDAARWPQFIAIASLFVLATLSVSSFFTRSRIRYAPQPPPDQPRFSPAQLMGDVGRALANRNFVMLLLGYVFLALTSGVRAGLWLYAATFYWRLDNAAITLFVIGSLTGYILGSATIARLHRRFGKRWTGAAAVLVYAIGPAIPLLLGHFGVLGPGTPGLLPILIGFSLLQHFPYSVMTTTVYSAMADIADENALRFGVRQEGILYSTSTLFGKVDQALGTWAAGWVLALIAFPAHAVPGRVPAAVLDHLALAIAAVTLPGLAAAWCYARMRITRADHDAVAAALAAQATTLERIPA